MKKNRRKTKEGWKKAHQKKVKLAFMSGAIENCKCMIESFKEIEETTEQESMTFAEIITFMELTMGFHKEAIAKND